MKYSQFGLIQSFILLSCIALVSCGHAIGSGKPLTQKRQIESFHTIIVSGSLSMDMKYGDTPSVIVSGDENIVQDVEVQVQNGILRIRVPKVAIQEQPIHVEVVTPTLVSIKAAITENVTINMHDKPWEELSVRLSGVGQLRIKNVVLSKLTAKMSGAGKLFIEGRVNEFNFEMSGVGKGQFQNLCAQSANTTIHGLGVVNVFAFKNLTAKVAGLGKVQYLGEPSLAPTVKGGGSIEPAKDIISTCPALAPENSSENQ